MIMHRVAALILTPARAAAAAFLIVLLTHVVLISVAGVNVPMWDSWDSEADWYVRMLSGNTDLQALISPHNEHRIAFTRIFNGLIFTAIGGWNPLAVMYVQALLISACVAMVIHSLFVLGGPWHIGGSCFTMLAFCFPFSWGNILSSFQNQFYFMLLFAIIAIRCATLGKSYVAYVLAVFLALVSPFTMAGGVGTIIIVFASLIFRALKVPAHRFF